MKQAVIFLVDDYADWEAAYLASTINQSPEWEVSTVAMSPEVRSMGGFTTRVDYLLADLQSTIDLLVLVGGQTWSEDYPLLKERVTDALEAGLPVGAICGAVDFLAREGLLTGYRHTGNAQVLWQDFAAYTNPDDFVLEQSVSDRNLVTANGTAPIDFTEKVLNLIEFAHLDDIERMIQLQRLGYYQFTERYGNPFF